MESRTSIAASAEDCSARMQGGLMLWRLEAKGYSRGRAWLEENNWVYRMGLLGYAVFGISAAVLSETRRIPDPRFFHLWVWLFFWIAHLPDLFSRDSGRPGAGYRHLLIPTLLSTANIAFAFTLARNPQYLMDRYPGAGDFALSVAIQALCVATAYLLHGIINLMVFASANLLERVSRFERWNRSLAQAHTQPPVHGSPANSKPTPPLRTRARVDSAAAVTPSPSIRPRGFPRQPGWWRGCILPASPQPILELLHILSTTPPKDIRATLRLVALVAMEGAERLKTPILLEAPERSLFLPDGTFNPTMAVRFLAHLPRIHRFVPDSRLGRRVYRPVARRLARELRDAWPRLLRTLMAAQSPAHQNVASLLFNAPPDQPILILCLGIPPLHHGRSMQRILRHLIRRNALRHLVTTKAASLQPEHDHAAEGAVLHRAHLCENRLLNRAGVHELEEPLSPIAEADLREATLILVPDTETARRIRQHLSETQPDPETLSAKVVEVPALLTTGSRNAESTSGTQPSRRAIHRNLAVLGTVLGESVFPVLLARAAQVEVPGIQTPNWNSDMGLESAPTPATAFRAALQTKAQPETLKHRGVHPERLLKLIWCIAQRDGSSLLLHGLPECLRSNRGDWSALDESVLWRCWVNLPFAPGIIPRNRARDYRPVLRLLRQSAATARLDDFPVNTP